MLRRGRQAFRRGRVTFQDEQLQLQQQQQQEPNAPVGFVYNAPLGLVAPARPHSDAASSSSSASATISVGKLDVPLNWFRPQWVEHFLERIDTLDDGVLSADERKLYRRAGLRMATLHASPPPPSPTVLDDDANERASFVPDGINVEDWKRIVKDYMLFVSTNADQIM